MREAVNPPLGTSKYSESDAGTPRFQSLRPGVTPSLPLIPLRRCGPNLFIVYNTKADDPVAMYLQDVYTIATNLAGLPGMSIPAGFSNGLPVGLQLMGNYFDEARMLDVAHAYQQVTDWHTIVPNLDKLNLVMPEGLA